MSAPNRNVCEKQALAPSEDRDMPFVALGRAGTPRWLVPAGPRLGDAAFLGWRPYRTTSRMAWAVMKSLLRWGAGRALPAADATHIDWIAELDWDALGWRQPAPPELLVYLGTPGPKRKAVVHLINRTSYACELIVKVPLTEEAKAAIEHEAETLFALQRDGFEAAPRLVTFDENQGVSSQTVIRGVRGGMRLTRETAELLETLARPKGPISLRSAVRPLEKEVDRLDLSARDSDLVRSVLQEVDDASQLPAVRVHGDFAPWNIRLQNGSATLVDWEDSQSRGLPMHDAYHFAHITRYLFGRAPRPAFPDLGFRYPERLGSAMLRKLELAYLLQRLVQKLAAGDVRHAAFLLTTLRLTMAVPA